MGVAVTGLPYENQADFGVRIDLTDGPEVFKFVVGQVNSYRRGGYCLTSGEILLANGKRFWAIIGISEQDSGEHFETYVPYRGEIKEQSEGFVGVLAPSSDEIFPYRYRYDAAVERDHHVGANGWSQP